MVFKIGNSLVGDNCRAFVVAEMSANHSGKIETALEIVRAAKRSGADALKLQTYTADTITINSNKEDFLIHKNSPWHNYKNLWSLYNFAHTPWDWHEEIFNEAKRIGLEVFSSPFDETAVDFLEKLNVPVYKIASPEITNIPLLEKVAKTGKPIILSSGLSSFSDLELAVKIIKTKGNSDICVLKCTTAYPCPPEEANLLTIKDISKKLGVISGISDHTLGSAAPIASVVLGGKIIEKHIILNNSEETADSFFSMNEDEFTKMVKDVRFIEKALGKVNYDITKSALPTLKKQKFIVRN
jgi:N-acetylneuraminate synthase/pseudaminic acid synthase